MRKREAFKDLESAKRKPLKNTLFMDMTGKYLAGRMMHHTKKLERGTNIEEHIQDLVELP